MRDAKQVFPTDDEQKRAEAVLANTNSTDKERMAAEAVLGYDQPDSDETGPSKAEIEFYSPFGVKGRIQ